MSVSARATEGINPVVISIATTSTAPVEARRFEVFVVREVIDFFKLVPSVIRVDHVASIVQ